MTLNPVTTGTVHVGDTVTSHTAGNVPAGTTVVSQTSGAAGSAGEYTVNNDCSSDLDTLDFNLRATGNVTAATGSTTITVAGSTPSNASAIQKAGIWPGYPIESITGIPAGSVIVSQTTGTPGADGNYVINHPTTAVITSTPCKFGVTATATGTSHGNILTVTGSSGNIGLGAVVTGTGLTANTTVESQRSSSFVGTADATGTQLTVSTVASNNISIGAIVSGSGVASGTKIVSQVSGTPGGAGVYTTDLSNTLTSAAVTFSVPTMAPGGGDGVYILSADATCSSVPVTFGPTDSAVQLTCTWKGVNGNDIRIDMNYYGSIGGETTPVGLGIQLPGTGFLTNGVGVPIFDTAIANLGEKNFEYVALPYTDSTSLNVWELEYGFEDVGRWGWRRQLYGHLFSARRDTYARLITFGNTRNSGVTSIMGMEMSAPSSVFDYCAAYTAKAQRALINDPARPLQTLSLNTVKLAPIQDRFNTIEINSLAGNGIATQKAGSDNQPMISRETTTYQLNLYGYQDDAYELVTTLATLARLIRNQRYTITSKYPRVKLADDGTRFGPGQAIVTPGIIKGELIAEYVMDMYNGLVENLAAFKANLIVERDPNDPNRINVLYGPDLINQLRIFAVLAQFRLQYDRGIDTQIVGSNPGTIGVTGLLPSPFFQSGGQVS
jgi:phage tail sheath gpL-like